jgi:cytochrome c-type biogenesis protein CcmH
MRRLLCFAFACALLATGAARAVDTEPPLPDPVLQARYEKLTQEIRCLVCQNEAIADSGAPLAADLRREIRRMVAAGQSEAEVKDFLLARYGDFVLYRPRFQATTAVLWLAPALLVLLVAFAVWRSVRRRAQLPSDLDADEPAPPAGRAG